MALNATMATAARSLEIFQTGIEVAGQNIANASTPGYIRQELAIEAAPNYKRGNEIHAMGSRLTGIQLALQTQLEYRIHAANADVAGADIRQRAYLGLEAILSELGSNDLSTKSSELLAALNEFANEPTLPGLRELVITEGEDFANAISYTRDQVDGLRGNINTQLEALVDEANSLVRQIDDLNVQIVRLEGGGAIKSDATTLRSERLAALDRLSEIVDIKVRELPTGAVDITSGTEYLISGTTIQGFESYVPDEDEGTVIGFGVEFSETGYRNLSSTGELGSLLYARDEILGAFTNQLDEYASAFIYEFNRIHSQGSGLSGFTSITSEFGVTDSTATLNDLAANGLKFGAEHGSFDVVVIDAETGIETTSTIRIDLDGLNGDDTTLDDLALALDGVANLNASIDADGHLQISSTAGYELRFDGDSSGVLAALGINTFYTGFDAETIGVSDVIRNDSSKLAAGRGGGPNDASNALEMIELFGKPLNQFGGKSLDEKYQSIVFDVSRASASEQADYEGYQLFHDSLMSQREQYSGVSLDEETVRLMQFQHSYQAAARVLSTLDELMQLLINI